MFGVLGPVAAWDADGGAVALKGPRHRAVLARLIVARRRVVPVSRLVEDLWIDPPAGAVGAVRTFVAALRRALEPERPPRAAARLLVTEGPGYALRAEPDAVDAWRFEQAVAATLPPEGVLTRLEEALNWWRGPAYAEFADEDWARAERSRLAELRLHAVERRAEARLTLGLAAEAVPDLDAHVAEHPWREDAWRLLALALYRTGRQGDALAVLRRARTLLVEQLGVDPGPGLRRLETDILHQAGHLDTAETTGRVEAKTAKATGQGWAETAEAAGRVRAETAEAAGRVWTETAAAYDRTVASGARARLESTVGLLRNLAVTGGGGLEEARRYRGAAVAAAEELGDAELTARVIGTYDVPAIWTRSDDPAQAAQIVAAAERTLTALPPGTHEAARARLLATIALESRGTRAARGPQAARQAEEIARRLDDPALLAFALNGVFMQTFHRAGLAPRRDEIGAELVALSARHGLVTYEVLGHLIRLQARSALADFPGADGHATAAELLARRHELPLVGVFVQWYRTLRLAATGQPFAAAGQGSWAEAASAPASLVEAAYRDAAARLDGAGMPGLRSGLLPLALLCLRLQYALPGEHWPLDLADEHADWGPYEPWARPCVLLAQDRRHAAAAALRLIPDPPRDLLYEALWCLAARAAIAVGDRETMERAHTELTPAAAELAGAGSGLLTLGPVATHLDDLAIALRRPH
ncbi:BTAD domain-containing putative transcriptional regulator [Nonomuraea aurantiaca]|uniref:BTAD domain-containing putative transcriptional regulator n=1 Tax=Nonomuraea aurantiaca TaxID=2878562 RepID=UPI001CD9CD8A|nr:BTAD domain-containing putative transcriptional regulator [Nonomuraea aurantiaca]MCA2225928.1 winged helix-turn-helix domain-containing protein [Nonomuraea aurantiaca]